MKDCLILVSCWQCISRISATAVILKSVNKIDTSLSSAVFIFNAVRRMSAGLLPQRTSNLREGPAAPRQKYISGWVVGMVPKIRSDILPTRTIIFAGVKECEI